MMQRPVSYALSLTAGAAVLALVAGSAGAAMLPTAAAQQASIVSSDAPKVDTVQYWGGGWGWGGGWHRHWGGWGGDGWEHHRRWCYWHPYACHGGW